MALQQEQSKLLVLGVLTCSAIAMNFGFISWVLYSPEVFIFFFFNVSRPEDLTDQSSQLFLFKLLVDFFPLGGLIGSLLSGYFGDTFGRKGSLMISNVFATICAILVCFDNVVYIYEFTICTRLFTGICAGVNLCLVLVYLCEISPRSMRGRIIVITDLFVRVGNIMAQILNIGNFLTNAQGWNILVILAGVIPVVLVFVLPYLPESPRYLLIQMGDEEKARNVLKNLKVSGDVEEEIEDLQQEDLLEKEEKKINLVRLIYVQTLWWQTVSTIVITAGTQLSGFHAVFYYSTQIFMGTELADESIKLLRVATDIILCLSSLLLIYLVDVVGRKIFVLTGLVICTACSILMFVVLEISKSKIAATKPLSYFNIILYTMFMIGDNIGTNIIPRIILLELFLQSARASAFAMSGFVYWLVTFVLATVYEKIEKKLGSYSLLLFCPFCVATFVYVYKIIPETKNQTFKDIRNTMAMQTKRKIHAKMDEANESSGDIL